MPFTELASLKARLWQSEMHGRYARGKIYLARFELITKNGETLPLGTLTTTKSPQELLSRNQTLGGLIAQVTGVPVTGIDPASIRQLP